jgi:hypothetical protein
MMRMDIKEYFESVKGVGVLATADTEGRVDAALYARPHMMDGEIVAFIMADRLTHSNVQSSPHAAYLFVENGGKYKGKRLFLTRIKEEKNSELLKSLRRREYPELEDEDRYLVYFRIDKVLPLVGTGEA